MASRTARFFAYFFDNCVLVAILIPSVLLSSGGQGDQFKTLQYVSGLVFILYLLCKDGIGGQSIGKKTLHIAVISERSRRPCNILQSIIRNGCFVILSIFDMIFILDNSKKRLGDRLAGTVVVSEQNLPRR
jgi:uncharacterized RDD family membrane protein YckC